MKKKVVLIKQTQDLIYEGIKSKGYTIYPAYREISYLMTFLRRFFLKAGLPFCCIWFNHNLRNLDADTIIIYESMIHPIFLKWIRKNNPSSRIIFFYFNIIRTTIHPSLIPGSIEKWSWDKGDCLKYNLSYNPGSGYIAPLIEIGKEKMYDIIFVGRDKGRYSDLMELQKKLEFYDLSTYFYIIPTRKYNISSKYKNFKTMSYRELLEKEMKANVILDFVQEGQTGTTYRTMESIFYSIKLITNNKEIKNYSFYRKENIFILGEDNMEYLYKFVHSPYLPLEQRIVDYYAFDEWLERFLKIPNENLPIV